MKRKDTAVDLKRGEPYSEQELDDLDFFFASGLAVDPPQAHTQKTTADQTQIQVAVAK